MGGGATRAFNVVSGLVAQGCEVTVVAAVPHYPTGRIDTRYRWKPLVSGPRANPFIIRTFVPPLESSGFLRRVILFLSFMVSSLLATPLIRRADIIWAANPNITAMYAARIFQLYMRCPLVQNVDDLWPESLYDLGFKGKSLFSRFAEIIACGAYRMASAITPVSPGYVGILTKRYRVPVNAIRVVRAGVDLHLFNPASKRTPPSHFNVLYIGALSPAYDFHQVLHAAKKLANQADIKIIIRGGGELAFRIVSESRDMGLLNVIVDTRVVSRKEVSKALDAADVLILPLAGLRFAELGISSKLYEYQAMAKPVICISAGCPARHVTETRCGVVVKPGDSSGLAEAIMYLKQNPVEALRMGRNGRLWVEANASANAVGLAILHVFSSCLRRTRTRSAESSNAGMGA
jgi:glycosyltransferase involved in cell wall biosynthesis